MISKLSWYSAYYFVAEHLTLSSDNQFNTALTQQPAPSILQSVKPLTQLPPHFRTTVAGTAPITPAQWIINLAVTSPVSIITPN